jgi:hypothetical protein
MASRAEARGPRRWGVGVEPTTRDAAALDWVADQYAVRADTMGLLLGRLSPDVPRTIHRWQYAAGQWAELPTLSDATVRYHLRRWLQAGWVRPQRALGRTWIVPTRAGLDLAGSGYRPWTLAPSQLQHLHAVAVVRLAIEAANPEAEWVSERALTRLRAQRRETWWRPDGGLVVADAAVNGSCPPLHTIEVELTPQAPGQAPRNLREPLPGRGPDHLLHPTRPPRGPAAAAGRAGAGHPGPQRTLVPGQHRPPARAAGALV